MPRQRGVTRSPPTKVTPSITTDREAHPLSTPAVLRRVPATQTIAESLGGHHSTPTSFYAPIKSHFETVHSKLDTHFRFRIVVEIQLNRTTMKARNTLLLLMGGAFVFLLDMNRCRHGTKTRSNPYTSRTEDLLNPKSHAKSARKRAVRLFCHMNTARLVTGAFPHSTVHLWGCGWAEGQFTSPGAVVNGSRGAVFPESGQVDAKDVVAMVNHSEF